MADIKIITAAMDISKIIGKCLAKHFPKSEVFVISDIPGEDHIYSRDEHGKPMFDMLVSSARKFAFVWYYIHPSKGLKMVAEMKDICLSNKKDFAVKMPNVPKKANGFPTIVRWGKNPAGLQLEEFIIKAGNPQLQEEIFSQENLNTYRSYDWHKVKKSFDKILSKAKTMAEERLKKHPDKLKNIRGYYLYAGCAYHWEYPKLGFGMRDIDVQVFFSPEWYTNTRCAFTRNCEIKEFGSPEYFRGKTRWLDLMWNSMHAETGDVDKDVIVYMGEMRAKSDRWATISQRPMINLETKKTIYTPNWIKILKEL